MFGDGKVIKQTETHIKIKFSTNEKEFQFPEAF
jgi:hypothetical protein